MRAVSATGTINHTEGRREILSQGWRMKRRPFAASEELRGCVAPGNAPGANSLGPAVHALDGDQPVRAGVRARSRASRAYDAAPTGKRTFVSCVDRVGSLPSTETRGPTKGLVTAPTQDHRRAVPPPARRDLDGEVHGHRRVRCLAQTLSLLARNMSDDDRVSSHCRINGLRTSDFAPTLIGRPRGQFTRPIAPARS